MDAIRDVRLELCVSGKYDNSADCFRSNEVKELPDGTNVTVVLSDGVLEFELRPIQDLRPVAIILAGEDPPFVVLCLNYKHAESGYEDVIDLSCSVSHSKCDVVKEVVVRRMEPCHYCARQPRLAAVP
jgi:hypothetical protein